MNSAPIIRLCQCNPSVGDIAGNLHLVINTLQKGQTDRVDLLVFPETVISGYSADDLITRPAFIDAAMAAAQECVNATTSGGPDILLGTPWRDAKDGQVYNASLLISNGKIIGHVYKHHLPNDGVFDDKRVFTAGPQSTPLPWRGYQLGVMICEDVWHANPAQELARKGANILIVQNASPYDTTKREKRLHTLRQRAAETGLPLCYLNQYGGQDDVVYDGNSVIMAADGTLLHTAKGFAPDEIDVTLPSLQIQNASPKADIHTLADMYDTATLGLRDYVRKNGFSSVLLGLSGGMDSAMVATIAADALGPENVTGVMLPSIYTSSDSFADAEDVARRLGIHTATIPISPVTDAFHGQMQLTGLAAENLQARVRGVMLMGLSNQNGALLLSTGNKSEVACGYATLYGDMCGAYNPIKDIYKTALYRLAAWRNTQGLVFNDSLLHKEPSAELREDQKDSDNLPPYDILDTILERLIEGEQSHAQIVAEGGFAPEIVTRIARLVRLAEYKRRQSCPGPKISPRAFGRERRYPITNLFTG